MRGLGVLGGVIAIAGGAWLLSLRAVSSDSLIASIANAIGLYCIGRGLFDISASLLISRQPQGTVQDLGQLGSSRFNAMTGTESDSLQWGDGRRFHSREEYESWKRSQPVKASDG